LADPWREEVPPARRDLVGQYPRNLTRQAVRELHQSAVDHMPPVADPDAPC
jgi:hypothetical protein